VVKVFKNQVGLGLCNVASDV